MKFISNFKFISKFRVVKVLTTFKGGIHDEDRGDKDIMRNYSSCTTGQTQFKP